MLHLLSRVNTVRSICRRILDVRRPSVWWDVYHFSRFGRLKWEDHGPNIYHDEGEEYMVKTAFTEELAVPAAFYLGLDDRASLNEADTLSDLVGEPGVNNYSRQSVASDATDLTAEQHGASGDWQVVTKAVDFTASGGDWPQVTNLFWCTSSDNTGRLLSTRPLSQARTVTDGETLTCSFTLRISE